MKYLLVIFFVFYIFYMIPVVLTYIDPGIVIDPPTFKECLFWGFKDPWSGWDKVGHKKHWENIAKTGELYYEINKRKNGWEKAND